MSIINDALKKAEREGKNRQIQKIISKITYKATPATTAETPATAAAPVTKKNYRLFSILAISLSVFLFASALFIFFTKKVSYKAKVVVPKVAPLRKSAQGEAAPQPKESPITQAQQPAEVTAPKKKITSVPNEQLPYLTLNGTILGKGEPMAIIENVILKKGDYIKGMKITGISGDTVELSYKGRNFTLKAR